MIQTLSETGSTNADLATRLRAGEVLAEGFWLVTDRQTAGRGRQGRVWDDGAGNFMGSTLVHLKAGDPPAPGLALVAGLALFGTVQQLLSVPVSLMLKWPNDLLLKGAKLAGILLERQGDAVIVGIGVNLSRAPSLMDRPTASLSELGPAPDRDSFAQSLADHFAQELGRWRSHGTELLHRRWLAAAHPLGTPLRVHASDGAPVSGAFAGLGPDGALMLRLEDGSTRAIHAGDVSLEDN